MSNAKEESSLPAANGRSSGSLEEPITLLDDNEDENISIGAVLNATNDKKRPTSAWQECASTASSSRKRILREDHEDYFKKIVPRDGCMLNPRHPIKIFATDRDKTTRRKLRRRLKKHQNGNGNNFQSVIDTMEEAYGNHWSVFHCWTFREMLGFDRFSGLRNQTQANLVGNNALSNSNAKNKIHQGGVGIEWIFITTYILDVDYLLYELPELLDIPSVVVVYQYKDLSEREDAWIREVRNRVGHNVTLLKRNPRNEPRTATNPTKTRMAYGCHHTKMTLVGYSSGRLRVHIHTSNLRREDVHDKCQGAFIQDFVPKNDDQLSHFVTSEFEESLVTYLESYQFVLPRLWNNTQSGTNEESEATTLVSHLQTYDFSPAVGVLIPSIPGYHKATLVAQSNRGGNDEVYGYLKVQKAIQEHCKNKSSNNRAGPIVCQFSSMGAVWEPFLDKVAVAWNADAVGGVAISPEATTTKCRHKKGELTASWLRFVWPTIREIQESVEGPAGGASVPGTAKNLHKAFLRPLLHKWKSGSDSDGGSSSHENECDGANIYEQHTEDDPLDKGNHVPHIKSYYQICENGNEDKEHNMLWFVLSSHNLSVAAWGQIQDRSRDFGREVLTIQNWEMGVFVTPSTLGVDAMGPASSKGPRNCLGDKCKATDNHTNETTRTIIPLPYKFRPIKYQNSDQPWVVG